MRLRVLPVGNSFGAPRWEWRIEDQPTELSPSYEHRWYMVSFRTGELDAADARPTDIDYRARGIARTRFGALREGRKALERIADVRRHREQEEIVIDRKSPPPAPEPGPAEPPHPPEHRPMS